MAFPTEQLMDMFPSIEISSESLKNKNKNASVL